MAYNKILYRKRLGQVVDPNIPACVDTNTGLAIPCASDSWIGWPILLTALGQAALSWGQALQQKQYYQGYGYQFPQLTSSTYQTQYNMLKQLHPTWSESEIREILQPTGYGTEGKIPTWVWVAFAAAGVLILLPILQKKT